MAEAATADGQGDVGLLERAFGSWESPITASFITTSGVNISSLMCHPDGTLLWLEARPQEKGRQVVCRRASPDEVAAGTSSERGGVEVTPADSYVRTRVHEYGGGAHLLGPGGDGVIYSNFSDQRLYWAKSDGSVIELTPTSVYEEDCLYRFADASIDIDRNRLICVREDHTNPKPTDVVNAICAVSLDGAGEMQVLIEGLDFYGAPRLSPSGDQLAYIGWDHPNMPWDATQLFVATLDAATGGVLSTSVVCGATSPTSVMQPSWSPDGELHFVADSTGWWNLYKLPKSGSGVVNLCKRDAEFSGCKPGWLLGGQNYCFLPDGRLVTKYRDPKTGACRLVILQESGDETVLDSELAVFTAAVEFGEECLPRVVEGYCPSPDGRKLYLLGGDPESPTGIYEWAVPDPGSCEASPAEMLCCSMRDDMRVDPGFISSPELVEFPTGEGETAFGYHYPPTNANYTAPEESKPPLLVMAHGGPTANTAVTFNPVIQFWTSRGFAVLDVDYRGSTGYGQEYRNRLYGNWGVVDIEDVCAGAEYLVKEGKVDAKMLAIDGKSAGGFTTLAALTFRDVFTAGCSMYGVGDLALLAGDTHKFESRYLDNLVGKYPEESEVYEARAPIKHADKLACPILLLQGAEDKIVPPNQAETMYDAVKDRGLPCALKIYEGEQHGFRQSENIQDALNSELLFYSRIFDFDVAGQNLPTLEVTNLDTIAAAE